MVVVDRSMSAASTPEPSPPPPRRYRMGGYRIDRETAVKWASYLMGKELHPESSMPAVTHVLHEKGVEHDIWVRPVGEVLRSHWMLVTQWAYFRGYKDMPSSEIPQFQPVAKDVIAKQLLDEAGIAQYEFTTVLN